MIGNAWTRRDALDLLTALSLSNLLFLSSAYELVYLPEDQLFWTQTFGAPIFAATVLNILAFTAVFSAATRYVRRRRPDLLPVARLAFLLALAPVALALRRHLGLGFMNVVNLIRDDPVLIGLGLAALAIVGAFAALRWFVLITRGLRVVVLVSFPFAVLTLVHLGAGMWAASGAPPPLPAAPEGPRAKTRVVWIIFDALDQRLAFDERPADVELPTFDAFGEVAVVAREAHSPGRDTAVSVPGLLSGTRFNRAEPRSRNELQLWSADSADPIEWSELSTVIEEAAAQHYRIRISGYYLPYCRLFRDWVQECHAWSALTIHPRGDLTLLEAVWAQLKSLSPVYPMQRTIDMYRESQADAEEAAADAEVDLVYLHAGFPHYPFIYDRSARRLTVTNFGPTAYLDNLVLTDIFFSRVWESMRRTATWDDSAVIVSSDHPFPDAEWIDGKRSERVPFMVKMPGQGERLVVERPINTALSKDLVLAILAGEVSDPAAARAFIEARGERKGREPETSRGSGSP